MAANASQSLPVLVLGAGGHAAVLIDALLRTNREVLGCLTPDARPGDTGPLGVPILGGDEALYACAPNTVALINGIGATDAVDIEGSHPRVAACRALRRRGFHFASVIHPTAVIAANCSIGEGAQIMAGTVIQTGTRIGADSIVNTGATIDHDSAIGALVHIAPGVTLCGGVTIGDGAFIGAGATVIPGRQIGASARVCAGMTILGDVPDSARLRPSASLVFHGSGVAPMKADRSPETIP